MKPLYANMDPQDWKRWFAQYNKTSIDEQGKVIDYSNPIEEMYQMFRARSIEELDE